MLDERNQNKKMNLTELKIGDRATITGFANENIPTKLYEIGILPGTSCTIYRKAPFSGPICISVGKEQSKLALRRSEASDVLVEIIK
jgi:ferrous iron transport protein A